MARKSGSFLFFSDVHRFFQATDAPALDTTSPASSDLSKNESVSIRHQIIRSASRFTDTENSQDSHAVPQKLAFFGPEIETLRENPVLCTRNSWVSTKTQGRGSSLSDRIQVACSIPLCD